MFNANIEITLEPTYYDDPPKIYWGVDQLQHSCILDGPYIINIDSKFPTGQHQIIINFYNKTVEDTYKPKDKAVIIKSVCVEGLTTTKISQGIYYPVFPKLWLHEQNETEQELFEKFCTSTYLGWNGNWIFTFSSPVYHWLHATENLGFFYK
jgi:hypothetical protein